MGSNETIKQAVMAGLGISAQAAQARFAEDDLCAELLHARPSGRSYDTSTIRSRLRDAPAAHKFFDPEATWAPESDFNLCTDVDRFNFVLRLMGRDQAHPWLEKIAL